MLTGIIKCVFSLDCAGAGACKHSGGGHGGQERHHPLQSAGQAEPQPHPNHRPRWVVTPTFKLSYIRGLSKTKLGYRTANAGKDGIHFIRNQTENNNYNFFFFFKKITIYIPDSNGNLTQIVSIHLFPHAGIKFLKHMNLTHLNLDGTGVSLAGLTSLLGLSNICCVRATNTRTIPLDDVSDPE